MMEFNLLQRVWYFLKRQTVGLVVIVVALLGLWIFGTMLTHKEAVTMVCESALRVGVGTCLILFVLKFGFPQLSVQTVIHDEPVALAIFAGAISIAIALLF
jgi:hypothetical protein